MSVARELLRTSARCVGFTLPHVRNDEARATLLCAMLLRTHRYGVVGTRLDIALVPMVHAIRAV